MLSKPVFANGTIPTGFLSRGTTVTLTSRLASKNAPPLLHSGRRQGSAAHSDLRAEGLRSTAISQVRLMIVIATLCYYLESHPRCTQNERWHAIQNHTPRRHYATVALFHVKTTTGSRLTQRCYKNVSCRNLQWQNEGAERCKMKRGKSNKVPIHHRFM